MKVLIVGCERSGTSVISNLLSLSSGLSILDDPPESWYYYPLLYQGLSHISPKLLYKLYKYKIVKIPGFATILPYLKKVHLSSYTIVYVIRDPRDVTASILERLSNDYNGLFINISWMSLQPNNLIESLSMRWRQYMIEAEKYSQNNKNIIFVKYEDFQADKLDFMLNLGERLDIKMDKDLISNKLDMQYRKSWSGKISGAKRYTNDLSVKDIQVIENICKNHIEKYYEG